MLYQISSLAIRTGNFDRLYFFAKVLFYFLGTIF
jgi:hypothetical protein